MGLFGSDDICFCSGKYMCPHRTHCMRARKPSRDEWVAISDFKPSEDGSCEHYLGKKGNRYVYGIGKK